MEDLTKQWYNTHQNKCISLRTTSRSDAGLLNPDSVITNLSDYVLSDVEKLALANGLKFTLPPKKLKSGSYLANFEVLYKNLSDSKFRDFDEDEIYFRESLSDIAYSSYFNYNMSRSSSLNITREQYVALVNLSKNKDIIITNPDKGSGVVILNRTDYIKKTEEIVNDTTKFKVHNDQDLYQVSRRIVRFVSFYLNTWRNQDFYQITNIRNCTQTVHIFRYFMAFLKCTSRMFRPGQFVPL